MDRRTLFKMSALSPMMISDHPLRILRAQFTIDAEVSTQMIITGHQSSASAELWRKGWENRAFESEGEWYLQSSKRMVLPGQLAELPGTLMEHSFVIGYAAEKRSLLVGTFRREHIACVIRVAADHHGEMLALAEWFASRPLPRPWELWWSGVQLQRFVPTTEEFGSEIEPNESFWP